MRRKHAHHTKANRQAGSIILYLVVGLVTFGVLALAGVTRFGSTVRGVLSPNCATSARYMAESGMRYAMAKLRSYSDETSLTAAVAAMNGQTVTVDSTKGLSFTLAVTYNSGTKTASVTSTGQSCSNILSVTSSVSNGSINLPSLAVTPSGVTISFANDISKFVSTGHVNPSGTTPITVNTTAKTVTFGNSGYSDAAAIWYTGNNTLCLDGNCTLGNGICAYWEHVFTASTGDGYVWTIMSGTTNTKYSFGGDSVLGELMGYGGPGTSGKGIQPPKLGLELDIWYNECGSSSCSYVTSSRCDPSTNDHAAFVFWGSNTVSGCNNTFDDNRHGAGAGTASEPVNSYNFTGDADGWDGYAERSGSSNWFKGGSRGYIRYELDRPTTANTDGNYVYTERAWIYTGTDTRPSNYSNCTATMSAAPTLVRTFALSPALHAQLQKVFFGWTEGTGGATQIVTLSNFLLTFKDPPTATAYTPPTGYVAAWNFSEAQGTTAKDLNANSHPMTLMGYAMWGQDARAYDNASLLLAGSGFATTPHKADLALTGGGTVSAWIKLNSYTYAGGIVHKGATTNDEDYSLQLNTNTSSGYLTFQAQNGWGTQFALNSPWGAIGLNTWYHVAVTWDNSTAKLYINGTKVSQQSMPGGWSTRNSGTALLIGAQNNTNGWPDYSYRGFDGLIDDVYIYNTVLNASQIAKLAGQ